MIIIVDAEARELITKLGDVALRAGGLGNMQPVARLLASMKAYQKPAEETEEPENGGKKDG